MRRDEVEHDSRFKQLISYVVLRFGNCVYSYVRGRESQEIRLIAKRSIGLGGHIEPRDENLLSSDESFYLAAARREVKEEIQLYTDYIEHVVALINDESDDVGRVHFGVAHIWDLSRPEVKRRERKITQAKFASVENLELVFDQLETWSQIALTILEDPKVPRYGMARRGK